MTYSLSEELQAHGDRDVWGVSPESLALAANARVTGRWDALERQYELQVLVTNYDPGWELYRDELDSLCESWLTPPLDRAVAFAGPETAATFFAGAVYFETPSELARVLVSGQELVENAEDGEPAVMPRRDLVGYAESESSRRLLRSLRIVQSVSDGYRLNESVFEALSAGFENSQSSAAAALLSRLLDAMNVEETGGLVEYLLSTFGIDLSETTTPNRGALPVLIRHHSLTDLVDSLFADEFSTIVDDLRTEQRTAIGRLDEARAFGYPGDKSPRSVEWPLDAPEAGVCALASQRDVPVVADWLADRLDTQPLAVLDCLTDTDLDVTYRDGLIEFNVPYQNPSSKPPAVGAYNEWLAKQGETLQRRLEALSQVRSRSSGLWERQRTALLESSLNGLDGWTVSPTRFAYTVFDPEHHADEYEIERYVGPSEELEREVEEIRRWQRERRHDAESFAELIPEVVSYPLEIEEVDDIVRIMCPWTNFTIQDYTALFERLLDRGVSIRLLVRLPTAREWNQLKSNLLSRLSDSRENLELRTYTRYREFNDHTELREMDPETEQRRRIGVHAKMFVAGSPEDGNVLVGSANLMENSLFYNPESGIQTRNPNVIAAAIDHFDLVWRLANPDRISRETFRSKTESRFFPRVYRPR